jgi:uncharacterized damage-inducible protein DinB
MADRNMTIASELAAELRNESQATRRLLERVPEDSFSWTPHPRSMTLGTLAMHIAMLPHAIAELLREQEVELPQVPLPQAESRADLLTVLERGIVSATEALAGWGDEGILDEWKLMNGAQPIMVMRRLDAVRNIMLNHSYHHRGQLTVYLRLLDVPLPPVYGPTADENPFG